MVETAGYLCAARHQENYSSRSYISMAGFRFQAKSKPGWSLVAIEGTPGKGGVTFLYAAMVELAVAKTDELIWLKPDIAASGLHGYDKRLLIRCS